MKFKILNPNMQFMITSMGLSISPGSNILLIISLLLSLPGLGTLVISGSACLVSLIASLTTSLTSLTTSLTTSLALSKILFFWLLLY